MVKLSEKSNFKKLTLRGGISLITLVITIVVIIILAAAVILSLNNNNLISNANMATVKNDMSEAQSAYSIYIGDLMVEELDNIQGKGIIGKTTSDFVTTTAAGVQETRNITLVDIGVDSNNVEEISIVGNQVVGIKWKNKYYDVNGKVVTEEEYANLIPEELGEGTRDKEKAAYSVPYVPTGFTYKEGTVSTGYVIQDNIGNEFVWIPVDGTNVTYKKWCTSGSSYDSENLLDDETFITVEEEKEMVETYGGFYISRYEAGVPENQTTIDGTSSKNSNVEGIPVSKKGAIVWTRISDDNAKKNAENMINTEYVKSGLLTGTMWDTVMLYLKKSGYDVEDNSSSWGNCSNSTGMAAVVVDGENKYGEKQTAGYSEYWKAQNIYDLSGNVFEWNSEYVLWGDRLFLYRGGAYWSRYSSSYRATDDTEPTFGDVGFRIALYIL